MSKNLLCLTLFAVVIMTAPVGADTLSGLADVTVIDGAIVSFRYEGTEYVVDDEVLSLGTTTRWYIDAGVEVLWPEGDPVPAAAPTVPNPSSNAKVGDVGSKADNFLFTLNGATDISSIDGINFQETVFPFLTNTFFHFERGGNDTGTWQAILADGSLGAPVSFSGATSYADTGVNVNGQNAFGVVFTTDVPVQGVRITAEGHDTLSISALTVIPVIATRPNPSDGAFHEDSWVNLSWSPGRLAVSHDVYLGDNFDDVDAGAESTFQGNQAGTFIVVGFPGMPLPEGLFPGTTYYWRVDEVNDTEPNSPWKGDVWSFMVPPKTAYYPDPADSAELVDPDVKISWTAGFGAMLHYIYFGDNFDDVNNATGGLPQGTATYTPGTLKLAKTYYWRVDEFDGVGTYKGDVWSFTTEGAVGDPDPANGAVDVKQTQIITWSSGIYAASHQLYFGTDKDAVKNADTGSPEYKGTGNLGAESYDPGMLEWDTTYYWRIDEVNNINPDSPWPGILWSFTTANFLIVDDFEDYDAGDNQIWYAWKDGLGYGTPGTEPYYPGNGTGSAVGDENTPSYTEETIVHGGNQSMPVFYDNSVLMYSEVEKTLTYPLDWTENGVNTLTIWFRGDSANAAETLYVALNGSAVVNHDNPNAVQITTWTQWTIDLQAFADQGVNLANVNTISLGLGNKKNPVAGGSGTMYFDDIRLYPPPPETTP